MSSRFLAPAEADLNGLYEYIRERAGPEAAIGLVRRVRAHCEGLTDFPERGLPRPDLRAGLRLTVVARRVVIAYVVTEATIEIGRIFYGGRDYEALMRPPSN